MEKFTKEQKNFLISIIDSKISERTGDYYNDRYVKAGLEQTKDIINALPSKDSENGDERMVKIIRSIRHGAGFSTCNTQFDGIEKDKDVIAFLEKGDVVSAVEVCEKKYPGSYAEGLKDCIVDTIRRGTAYRIIAYDGLETLKTMNDEIKWKVA